MTKNRRQLEILIGIILSLAAGFFLFASYKFLDYQLGFLNKHKLSNPEVEIPWFRVMINHHLSFLTNLALLTGGVFLITGKKFAWVLSLISCSYECISFAIVALTRKDPEYNWIFYIIVLFFLLLLTALISKPFREKYAPTKKDWLIVSVSILVLLLDRFLI